MIATGQKVQIQYAGTLENGYDFVNTWLNGGPVEVTVGQDAFLPAFERALRGLGRGERAVITIPMEDAYGPYDERNVIELPLASIPRGDELPVGSFVTVQTEAGQARVKVVSVENGVVKIDCNHELAGHDLTFEIELVRDGTETLVESEAHSTGCGCGCDKLKEQLMGETCTCGHTHEHGSAA